MKTTVWRSVFLAVLLSALARPDTVTKIDHSSVNGSLTKMSGDVITWEARYPGGPQTQQIAMSEVASIEFNDTTFNPGAPPAPLGIAPPKPQKGKSATTTRARPQTVSPDTLILRGGMRKSCQVTTIDQQFVHCAGKGLDFPRATTLLVLVSAR
jgi:hypothetical protein